MSGFTAVLLSPFIPMISAHVIELEGIIIGKTTQMTQQTKNLGLIITHDPTAGIFAVQTGLQSPIHFQPVVDKKLCFSDEHNLDCSKPIHHCISTLTLGIPEVVKDLRGRRRKDILLLRFGEYSKR